MCPFVYERILRLVTSSKRDGTGFVDRSWFKNFGVPGTPLKVGSGTWTVFYITYYIKIDDSGLSSVLDTSDFVVLQRRQNFVKFLVSYQRE